MRILTIISGILLAAGGGFCYYFSTSPFAALAFVLGALMVLSGGLILLTYVMGVRKPSGLPDTVFVEGLVTVLFGFAVLNNQVSDIMLTTFFGTWLTLSGTTRLSQSFSISRHNPRDWAKIIPFSLLSMVCGVVMLMQTLVEAYNPVALVGTALLLNAISILLYAVYMKPHIPRKRELEAKARADAKIAAAEEKRSFKEKLRRMPRAERKAAKAAAKEEAKKKKAGNGASAETEEAAENGNKNSEAASLSITRDLTKELAEIKEEGKIDKEGEEKGSEAEIAEAIQEIHEKPSGSLAKEPKSPERLSETAEAVIVESAAISDAAESAASSESAESTESEDDFAEEILEGASEEALDEEPAADVKPTWHKPTEIPSLRKEAPKEIAAQEEPEEPQPEPRISAVNLADLEGEKEVAFEKVELPEPEFLAEGGEAELRGEFLAELEKSDRSATPISSFTPLRLEDLIEERPKKSFSEEEKEALEARLTAEYSFKWPERVNN